MTLDDGRTVSPRTWSARRAPGRTVVYSGDTRPPCAVLEAARGADLLVHEATFGEEEAAARGGDRALDRARRRRGSRVEAGVRRLVLTHISPRYTRDAPELLAEARAVFPETTVARDGLVVDVPFAE